MNVATKLVPGKAPKGGFFIGLEINGTAVATAWGFTKFEARQALRLELLEAGYTRQEARSILQKGGAL